MPKKSNEERYAQAEAELLGEAIAETEREIAEEALGEEPSENDGDDSLEQFDDDIPGDEDETASDDADEVEASGDDEEGDEPGDRQDRGRQHGEDDRGDRRGVPSGRLREQSERTRAAEAEREAAKAEARELRARLEALERGQTKPAQEQKPEAPDMFADPDAWKAHQRAEIVQEIETKRINGSFQDARDEHGDAFVEAFQALQRTGQGGDTATVQRIVNSSNPGRALMNWHERQALMSEIGDDPAAYREKVRQQLMNDPDVRRQVLTGMRESAMRGEGDGAPRTRTRLPPSLSAARGGASHRGADMAPRSTKSIEQEIADSVWEN